MKIETRGVHAGDRKPASPAVPVTTPIYTASSFFYGRMEDLDRVFGDNEGYSYARYRNPTNAALEELAASLEGGAGALATSSGMNAIVWYVDVCDLETVKRAVAEEKPGCLLMETISNPLLRVGSIDRLAGIARGCGAALVVDNTFATPLLVRPLEDLAQALG